MQLAGIPCEIIVSGVDETIEGEPHEQVRGLALRKARAVRDSLSESAIVIGADTLVYIDGMVLGKPHDTGEAFKMLRLLSGRMHHVYTGVALLKGDYEHVFADVTEVYFHELSDEEINEYIKTGEPFDKAGAYGVQERGAVLVDKVNGDFYTVVGLPISKVSRALSEIDWKTT